MAQEKFGQAAPDESSDMWRLLKLLFFLLVVAGIAIVGYAYIGDLSPTRTDVTEPVDLNAN